MKRWILAMALVCAIPAQASAAPKEVQGLDVWQMVLGKDARKLARPCYTTKGTGIKIKTTDRCPNRKKVEREVKGLFERLGAPQQWLHGQVVTFSRYKFLIKFNDGRYLWVDGATWVPYGKEPKDFTKYSWSIVSTDTTNTTNKVSMDTFVHELGHASFGKAGIPSPFLDTKAASVEKRAVMDRDFELPKDHPARDKFKALQ